jgi:hypothetical protein
MPTKRVYHLMYYPPHKPSQVLYVGTLRQCQEEEIRNKICVDNYLCFSHRIEIIMYKEATGREHLPKRKPQKPTTTLQRLNALSDAKHIIYPDDVAKRIAEIEEIINAT